MKVTIIPIVTGALGTVTKLLILWSAGTSKSTILQILFFFLLIIIITSGLLAGIRWSVCMLKSHRSLSGSKSPKVSRTLLSILADLNNWSIRIVSIRHLVSISFNLSSRLQYRSKCTNFLWHHFHSQINSFLSSPARSKYLSIFSPFFYFHSVIHRKVKIPSTTRSFFLLMNSRFDLLVRIRWSVCTSKT